ncbi:hypothetical protein BDP27DRAFT_1426045 [Rhodocollybia butyracea]|uniref:G domain-containing protein n=1 Tax=Rhodocollybia butyracea TaxID=206335 RepID=A0A9P5PEP2_9AGAR|nr:hypothetical protein BDP27DRAFT_1426045 [Rhodocollybia butyracea]
MFTSLGISSPPSPSSRSTLRQQNSSIIAQELASSTKEILKWFRILVIGKSGAGKSALINAAFDIDTANVSHETSGVSDINTEITSSHRNTRFIMHDSQGFAVGETQNYAKVQKFITDRAKEPEMKDRLHAIWQVWHWFCLEIPTENGALVERVDENFLQLDLQSVPIVVIFTKYDLLVRKFEREADDSIGDEERETMASQQANEFYNETCVLPLENITPMNRLVPVKVSTKKPKYTNTLVKLVEETQNCLNDSLANMLTFAQRVNEYVKLSFGNKKTHLLFGMGMGSGSSQKPRVRKDLRLKKLTEVLKKFGIKSMSKLPATSSAGHTDIGEPLLEYKGHVNAQEGGRRRSGNAHHATASLGNKDRVRFLPEPNANVLESNYIASPHHHEPISTFVIFSPNLISPDTLPSQQSTSSTGPNYNLVISTHSPDDTVQWLETHYDDSLLRDIRKYGLGGPIPAMLSMDEPALVIFGSILDHWVLEAAKVLSEESHFAVIIRAPEDDPGKTWSILTEELSASPHSESRETKIVSGRDSTEIHQGSNSSEDSQGFAIGEDSVYHSDISGDSTDGQDRVFRLRGGADSEFEPWNRPEHKINANFNVEESGKLKCQVKILSTIKFIIQSAYTDQSKNISQPQVISNTNFQAYQKLQAKTTQGLLCSQPDNKNYKNYHNGVTGALAGAGGPSGGATVTGSYAKASAVEQQDDRITPPWIVDYQSAFWDDHSDPEESYWAHDISYTNTLSHNKYNSLEVEFGLELQVEPCDRETLEVGFVAQNQTMMWLRHASLKSQGYGIIVHTSYHIPDVKATTGLNIDKNQRFKLADNELTTITLNTQSHAPAQYPAPLLSIQPAPAKRNWINWIRKNLTTRSAAQAEQYYKISRLPRSDDFKAEPSFASYFYHWRGIKRNAIASKPILSY